MRLSHFYITLCFISSALCFNACQETAFTTPLPEKIDFNFHIRPILSDNCFLCHGPDASSREADLRLDLETAAKAILDNGKRPIHAGNWLASEISHRVTSDDPDIQMPPPEMNKQLSKREVALLEKWMEQGAEWKEYWAFIPPELPTDESFNTLSNTVQKIDYFINKSLITNDLKSSEKADKYALTRRLSYLLTGLPPSPKIIEQLATSNQVNSDSSEQPVYEQLVHHYLASPQFGERWARHWMDLVRFAEYKGHEFDYPVIGAWQYRDYLIRAFNQDVPYDQFITEQLAGDLLESPRINPENGLNESIHGTQFYTFSENKHSPVSIKQEEADMFDNMIDVTTKTFQSLTVACARCHDHKFDPIPTTDYYSLYGIFESTRFTLIPSQTGLDAFAKVDSIEAIKQKMREILGKELVTNKEISSNNRRSISSSYQKILTSPPASQQATIIADFRDGTLNNWTSNGLAFNNKNALGEPIFDNHGKLLELANSKASSRILGKGIQGALRSPTFIIDKEKLVVRAAGEDAMIRLIVDNFQLIQDPIYGSLEKQVHEGAMKDYVLDLRMVQGTKAYIELLPGRKTSKGGKGHYYEFDRKAWIEAEYAILFDGKTIPSPPTPKQFDVANKITAYQNWVKGKPNPAEVTLINQDIRLGKWQKHAAHLSSLHQQTQDLTQQLYDSTFFQGVTEGDAQLSPVFIRGNRTTLSTEKVPHQFFAILKAYSPTFPSTGSGRTELAIAITNPKNPLTARVMVNRIWHHLFGRGIVETVDNFGLQGKIPTHPELLDFLAIQFVQEGWSIKKLIKNIVLTEAFQRSTVPSTSALEKDPQNLYLSHFPVRRLEAEAIRDGLLAVSGRLDKTMYGEPFEIYLTDFIKGRGRPQKSGALDGDGRRSIYQTIRRNFLPPFMLTFDMPAPFSTFGKRNTSNVPAQSLTMMNDPLVQQQAEVWANRIVKKSASFKERITTVYLTAFARLPTATEMKNAQDFFKEQAAIYGIEGANSLEDKRVWIDYCHTIFMMKEFIFLTN